MTLIISSPEKSNFSHIPEDYLWVSADDTILLQQVLNEFGVYRENKAGPPNRKWLEDPVNPLHVSETQTRTESWPTNRTDGGSGDGGFSSDPSVWHITAWWPSSSNPPPDLMNEPHSRSEIRHKLPPLFPPVWSLFRTSGAEAVGPNTMPTHHGAKHH